MNSKIEARIEAVKLALNVEGVTSENIIEVSKKIADFVIGEAELPDSYNANSELQAMMAKIAAPNPEIEKLQLEREKKLTELLTNTAKRNDETTVTETAEKA